MCAEQGVHVGAATAFDADLPLQCLDKLLCVFFGGHCFCVFGFYAVFGSRK